MDHLWDGFYTSMLRLSRFVALVEGGSGVFYEIDYKGTPPAKQRFSLRTDDASVTFRIKYPKAGAYIVKDFRGNLIKANDWDRTL